MRRNALVICVISVLTLVGCSNADSGGEGPPTTPDATASTLSEAARARLIAACTDALRASKGDSADDGAPECEELPAEDYLQAIKEASKQK
ncbi:hypothetical protein AB0942_17690 [Streptomyces nodosus]|uniref:hypothetical protein n=1 Tax=Streptomyces nodosus TaxID=40318 RepID=UPI003451B7DC